MLGLYEQLHNNRAGIVAIDRNGDALDALSDYLDAAVDEREAKDRKKTALAGLVGALGTADTAVRDGRIAFTYDETSREYVDRERLREEFPDAYTACVEDRPSRRINIPKTVREAHQA